MEENDKEFRQSFCLPMFFHTYKEGKSIYSVNIPKIMFLFALIMLVALYVSLLLGCLSNFYCKSFLPSPSYLGCFRGHDRVMIAAYTYYALVLPLMYIGAYCHYLPILSNTKRALLKYTGIASCLFLPLIAYTNDINGTHVLPFEPIHNFACIVFLFANILWSCMVFLNIKNTETVLNSKEKSWYFFLNAILWSWVAIGVLALLEWEFAYSLYANSLFNEYVKSLCEWVLVTLAIVMPPVFCQFFRGLVLTFTIDFDLKETGKDESVEMADLKN
ncbi:unnamed protein product [Blepharisma stoltei]|uniref:Uncharacterized protein n=1 Tax=Blepharisma stoltei TaxID=1481888 RepID=A0AAU9J1G2_9CILI|nr:unnamed protein product [Blepharisma stoltei]